MKVIMTLIVTFSLIVFSLHASNPPIKSEFTVTKLALEAEHEIDVKMQEMLEGIIEDSNNTQEGDNTER